jgi:hypothetical protein
MSNRSFVATAFALALILAVPANAHAQAKPKPRPAATAKAKAKAAPAPAAAIATVLGQKVTKADLGTPPPMLEQIAQGDAAKLATLKKAWESQALTGMVLGMLLERYTLAQKIEVSPVEVSEMLAAASRAAASPEAVKAGATAPDTTNEQVRMASAAVIQRFKMHRALHKQFGGRVLMDPQAGPLPFDAYKSFLEAEQKAGAFTVTAPWKERFWSAFTGDQGKQFMPVAEAEKAISTPWWREDVR